MNISRTRVGGIAVKELTEYRRSGSVVSTMAIIPLVFILPPMIQIFTAAPGALGSGDRLLHARHPGIVPSVVAALTAYGVIRPTLGLALGLGLGVALVALDVPGWRITSGLVDRERLIVGSR